MFIVKSIDSPRQSNTGDEIKRLKRTIQALCVGFSGLLIIVVGGMAIMSGESAEGSPTPGTCLPLNKGGTGCDALPIANGGTGADTVNGARQALGGVDVVKSGNWTHFRYADGTWMGVFQGTLSFGASAAWGTIYSSGAITMPAIPSGYSGNVISHQVVASAFWTIATSTTMYVINAHSFTASSAPFRITYLGTWN